MSSNLWTIEICIKQGYVSIFYIHLFYLTSFLAGINFFQLYSNYAMLLLFIYSISIIYVLYYFYSLRALY